MTTAPSLRLVACLVAVAASGCGISRIGAVQAGLVHALPRGDLRGDGAAVEGRVAVGAAPLIVETRARLRLGPDTLRLAVPTAGFMIFSAGSHLSPYVSAGAELFAVERYAGRTAFGVGTPFLELGLGIALGRSWAGRPTFGGWVRHRGALLTLSVVAEYDVRFGRPDTPYVALEIGLAAANLSIR